MCRSMTLRFACGHKHFILLTRCRCTKHITKHKRPTPTCKATRKTGLLPHLRLTKTPCPNCYILHNWNPTVNAAVQASLQWQTTGEMIVWAGRCLQDTGKKVIPGLQVEMRAAERVKTLLERKERELDEMGEMIGMLKFAKSKYEGDVWDDKSYSNTRRPLGKRVLGGSPLRKEWKREDFEEVVVEEKKDKRKDSEVLSWREQMVMDMQAKKERRRKAEWASERGMIYQDEPVDRGFVLSCFGL